MQKALITGGGSGIGKGLALALAAKGVHVYIVGRTQSKLDEVSAIYPELISCIVADISTKAGRQLIVYQLKNKPIDFLVHNAAVTGPLKSIANVREDEWAECFAINVEGPLFLTQKLLPNLHNGARVLNISSGLAHRVMPGVSAYSCSKAALYMMYQAFKKDLGGDILFGSIRPGVVDTGMQDKLRADNNEFASQGVFKAFNDDGLLTSIEEVAHNLVGMLLNMSDELFVSKEWDVREDDFKENI